MTWTLTVASVTTKVAAISALDVPGHQLPDLPLPRAQLAHLAAVGLVLLQGLLERRS